MTKPLAAVYPLEKAKDRIIVALDVATAAEAREIVAALDGVVSTFKVGSQLFTAAGPEFVKELTGRGHRVFLDLKFHDIPNTVANAVVESARLGVWMVNIHALGGGEMMKDAANAIRAVAEAEGIRRPLLIAVTVLTSSDDETLKQIGIDSSAADQVARLAGLAAKCGVDGVVASPLEARAIRSAVDRKDFAIVTPGIRQAATNDDQKRVTTVAEAFANGSTYVVIGRPVIGAADRAAAAKLFVEEAERAIQ